MKTDDMIRDEKLQHDVNRDVAEVSVFSSGKIDQCEYLTGEEILPTNRRQIIEQVKLTYFLLGNALEKQTGKQVCDYESKQVESIFPKTLLTGLIKNKVNELIKLQSINLD